MSSASSSEDEECGSESTPPELLEDDVKVDFLPQKSREMYWSVYLTFMKWKDENNLKDISEDILLTYFNELSLKYKYSSLLSKYSMLRSTIEIKHNIALSTYKRLQAFLKEKSNGYEPRKTKLLTPNDVKTFLNEAPDLEYLDCKVALIFSLFGGCRYCELVKLTVNDVIDLGKVIKVILKFGNSKTTRNFFIEGEPMEKIKAYQALRPKHASTDRYLLAYRKGKCVNQPIGKNKLGTMPKEIARYLKLDNPEMYTGHAFRKLSAVPNIDQGIDIQTADFHTKLGRWKSSALAEDYMDQSTNDGNHEPIVTVFTESPNLEEDEPDEQDEPAPKKVKSEAPPEPTTRLQNVSDLSFRADKVTLQIINSSNINIYFQK